MNGSELFADAGGAGGPRSKKVKMDAPRPMCTNCEQCQLRKGKCDGGRPICGWCAANNKPCIYQEKKKPGLKAGYGRDLEKRLTNLEENITSREDELERKIQFLEEQLESHSKLIESMHQSRTIKNLPTHISSPASGHANLQMLPTSSPVASAHPSHSGASIQPFSQSNGAFSNYGSPAASSQTSLPHSDNLLSHRSSVPPHGGYNAAAAAAAAAASAQLVTRHASPPQPGTANGLLPDPDLPPFDLSYDLVDLYFQRINPWFPLLDRKSTVSKILRSTAEEDMILLHAIIATTIRFYDRSAAKGMYKPEYEARRHEWHATSKKKVIFHSFETPSIRRLQALAILSLDMIGEQNGGPGMFILASIARCATQLGLTSETFSLTTSPDYPTISTLRAAVLPDPEDWVEDESRRRLLWLIYMLDRDTTVATAFDFVLDEATIDRKLPCKDELFTQNRQVETRWFETSRRSDYSIDRPENLGAFSYLIELKGLMSKIHQFLKMPVNINARPEVDRWRHSYREIDTKLRTWRANIPYEFRNVDQVLKSDDETPASCMWVLLQITYYTVFIRMHSSAAYPPHKTPIFKPSVSAANQCFQAVERITALTKYIIQHGMLNQQGPPFAFSLWVAARVLLVHGSAVERQVSNDIHFLIQTLHRIGEFWPVSARYAQILQRVMNEYAESQMASASAIAANSGTVPPQPPSVTILSDMRRCAYDLDVLISNEPLRQSSSTLMSGWQAPMAKPTDAPMINELDYLETFNFFNYPRVPMAGGHGTDNSFNACYSSPSDGASQASISNFNMQDMSSDWLSTHFT